MTILSHDQHKNADGINSPKDIPMAFARLVARIFKSLGIIIVVRFIKCLPELHPASQDSTILSEA